MKSFSSKIGIISSVIAITAIVGGSFAYSHYQDELLWNRICDGTEFTSKCTADDGIRYSKYIFHDAEPEKTKIIQHPEEPAITHTVYHPAVYGTRRVITGCIRTNISYKNGTCALSRCRDGMYSGSTGWGTCNYHGGVWYTGGPWYNYREESYIVKAAWNETVVDVPAKEAWKETVVVSPAKEAYYEKEPAV